MAVGLSGRVFTRNTQPAEGYALAQKWHAPHQQQTTYRHDETGVTQTRQGLSRLGRDAAFCIHTAEVTGSIPVSPTARFSQPRQGSGKRARMTTLQILAQSGSPERDSTATLEKYLGAQSEPDPLGYSDTPWVWHSDGTRSLRSL
jgi:hypothetical protein